MGQILGGGGGNSQTQTQTTSTNMDPAYLEHLKKTYAMSEDIANTPYQAYGGPGMVGPTQGMNNASNITEGMAIHGNKPVNQAVTNLGLAAGNIGPKYQSVNLNGPEGQFNAPQIAANAMQTENIQSSYQSPNIQQNAFSGPELDPMTANQYNERIKARMDPYQDQVVDATMRDIEEQRQKQLNVDSASAVAANAFGGSRHGLVEAETNKSANQQAIDAAARLRSQGFGQAMSSVDAEQNRIQGLLLDRAKASAADTRSGESLSLQDQATASGQELDAQGMNIQQQIAAAKDKRTGEGLSLDAAQTDMQSQQNMLAMKLQQSGMSAEDAQNAAAMQLQAYQAQGNLALGGGNQQLNAAGNLYNMGSGMMDAQNQKNMFQYQQYLAAQQDPYNKLGAMTAALGAPTPTTTTQTMTQPGQKSNPFGSALGGAASGASAGFMMGGPVGAMYGAGIGGGLGLLSSLG